MKLDLTDVKKMALRYALDYTKEVSQNLKNMPNQAWIGLGRPQHKLTKTQVVVARIALAAVAIVVEVALEK